VLYVSSEEFTNDNQRHSLASTGIPEKYRSIDVLLVDDVQFIAGKNPLGRSFSHFNTLHGQINKLWSLRSTAESLGLWKNACSRFEWGLTADISRPISDRLAILRSKLSGSAGRCRMS
jgi:chromosomal replication initiator protein